MAWTGDDAAFQGFIDKHGLTFTQLSDDNGEVFARFGVPAQPALALVGTDGKVTVTMGAVEAASLDAALESATS